MTIKGDKVILHKSELNSFSNMIIDRLEELVIERDKLERKLKDLQKIDLEQIQENELLPDGFYHPSKLN